MWWRRPRWQKQVGFYQDHLFLAASLSADVCKPLPGDLPGLVSVLVSLSSSLLLCCAGPKILVLDKALNIEQEVGELSSLLLLTELLSCSSPAVSPQQPQPPPTTTALCSSMALTRASWPSPSCTRANFYPHGNHTLLLCLWSR